MALHPVHTLTSTELATLRTRIPEQSTQLRLAIWPKYPDAIVWEARVTLPLPASDDMVYEVKFDGGGAGFASTIRDQTVWIGSAAQSYDRGITRLREAAPGVSGTLKIGEISDIEWTDDDYITVVDEFGLWPRHAFMNDSGVLFMDREIAYSDQNEYPDPVPVLLPDAVVEYDGVLGGAVTVDVKFDASDSWAIDGGALTYSWSAPGASATAGMSTATPTVTYNSAGVFRVACTVSRNYGGGKVKTFTGYRHVHIYDDDNLPLVKFTLGSCSGSWSSGGWSFTVTMEDDAKRSEIVDRAKVILFAKDNTTSVGPIKSDAHGTLRANILAVGWIAGETIDWDNEKGTVEFEVQGPQFWFDKMTAFPHGLEDYDGSPTTWLEFDDLEVRKGDWHFLHWHTTATRMMDTYVPVADARQIRQYAAPGSSSLWEQLTRVNEATILAHPACDRYGRLWIQRPLSLMFLDERTGIPSIMEILRQDWRDQITIERRTVGEIASVDGSGIGYLDGTADPFYMLAPGHVYKRYGGVETIERLALFRLQATNNTLMGLVLDYLNNPYPNVDIRLAGYYRVFDIVPQQRVVMNVTEDDTERGITWVDRNLVPMMVSFTHDGAEGVLEVDMTLEAETYGVDAITGDPPPTLPIVPINPRPPPPPPPPPPILPEEPPEMVMMVLNWGSTRILVRTENFQDASPTWATTLTGLLGPYHYKADLLAQTAYSLYGWDASCYLYKITDFDTASPSESTINIGTHPDVEWLYGGYLFNNLAVAPGDPDYLGLGVKNELASRGKFHQSTNGGTNWSKSIDFPSETNYYGNNASGPQGVYGKAGATGTWYMAVKCGWYGPIYGYEVVGVDVGGASRYMIEDDPFVYYQHKTLVSAMDGLGSFWFEAQQGGGPPMKIFKGTTASPSLDGNFACWAMVPYEPSTPAVILTTRQAKVYRAGWQNMGNTSLITDACFIAPCSRYGSLRWAIGGSGIIVDPGDPDAIVKYTGNGGDDNADWFDKTGNLHTLLDGLGWTWVTVHTIIPKLEG